MEHNERERERGRGSRASSTSSLGREVRCACQFFQSDSLLPERRAMIVTSRPSSRTAQRPVTPSNLHGVTSSTPHLNATAHGEHEYEPIGTPLVNPRTMTPISVAPVVRIIDTDVVPVADSDDSIDLGGRFTPGPVLEGNEFILPLDGKIEDSTMETKELVGGGDTSEEVDSPQELQDRFEEHFLKAATPCTESRTDGEVHTSQVDSSRVEEQALQRGARGLPQRLRTQAGKLRSRIKSMQRPNFSLPIDRLRSGKKVKEVKPSSVSTSSKRRGAASERRKPGSDKRSSEKSKSSSLEKSSRVSTGASSTKSDKRSRMERIRSSLADRPRLSFPDRSKFHLPARGKFTFPDRSKFHLPDRPRLNIKKPNISFPKLGKSRTNASPQQAEHDSEPTENSSGASKRNIFDFTTYPRRLFDRKAKNREYATSSPKESRAESTESSTLPRVKKPSRGIVTPKWALRFTDIKFADEDDEEIGTSRIERSKPWRRPSQEEPRLSISLQQRSDEGTDIPWEYSGEKGPPHDEEIPYDDEHEEEEEMSKKEILRPRALRGKLSRNLEDSYEEEEPPRIDPRLYGSQGVRGDLEIEEIEREGIDESNFRLSAHGDKFEPVDPRFFHEKMQVFPGEEEEEEEEEDDEEPISSGLEASIRSDREQQQSSGSSCDRRRRGVIEEIDSDEFFLREKGISQDDMNVGRYLTSEIRDALRTPENALAHEIVILSPRPVPPKRPERRKSMKKSQEEKEPSPGPEIRPPARVKRDSVRRSVEESFDEEKMHDDEIPFPEIHEDTSSVSDSRHRIVYHAESPGIRENRVEEPLDDIVVVKPIRRKSRTSLRSQSLRRSESLVEEPEDIAFKTAPSAPPRRRKRLRRDLESPNVYSIPRVNHENACNGHHSPSVDHVEKEEIMKLEKSIPKKPERATSREALRGQSGQKMIEDDYIEPVVAPIAPKRSSRSRGPSLARDEEVDDGRTSRGGSESIPDIAYDEEIRRFQDMEREGDYEEPEDDEEPSKSSRPDYPDYALIEKREKPPRPPPPRTKRLEKFATCPRPGKSAPVRPRRSFSALRSRSRSSSELQGVSILQDDLGTRNYEELDSEGNINKINDYEEEEEEKVEKNRRNANIIVRKIQGRPLPAPPRPPRVRRDRSQDGGVFENPEETPESANEAFASTQTDPLPDDMVIAEEEITRAKLIVSPSRSGSQILVSTERFPSSPGSPINFPIESRSVSHGALPRERVPTPAFVQYSKSSEFTNEPPERTVSQPFPGRLRRSPSPVRRSTAPTVPPLPVQKPFYPDDEYEEEDREVAHHHSTRRSHRPVNDPDACPSKSPSLIDEMIRDEYERDMETRLQSSLSERIRLEEELERARNLGSAILANEPLKIANLEVADLRVDRLNVTNIEAGNISASEIDALVLSTAELTNSGEQPSTEANAELQATLLRELMAIRSQLECVQSSQESSAKKNFDLEKHVDRERPKSFSEPEVPVVPARQKSAQAHLQLDEVSRTTETRAIFSSVSSSRESSPQPSIPPLPSTIGSPAPIKLETSPRQEKEHPEELFKTEIRSSTSRSRSPSPARAPTPPGVFRQTASPVRSLPPVISVTPDTPDVSQRPVRAASDSSRPQRATISYVRDLEDFSPESLREIISQRSSPPPIGRPTPGYISTSQIPPEFFNLASPARTTHEQEPGVSELSRQLFGALRLASKRAMRHFVGYIVNRIGHEETDTKIREVELALCALLLIIAGLLIVCLCGPRTITHHHHWDYFNPPRL